MNVFPGEPLHLPYPSRRVPIYAPNGVVATGQPLAAQAGLRILQEGGNAVDAAVAAAAALTVVEPTANGIGSDTFAIIATPDGQLYGLNASGPSPASLTREAVTAAGHTSMPSHGVLPITVPGTPAAWNALVSRFGRLSLQQVLAPAIQYARAGHPVAPGVAAGWRGAWRVYSERFTEPVYRPWFDTFAAGGRPPAAGELWASPGHAATLEQIAETGARAFYEGPLAEAMERFLAEHGGYLEVKDLKAFEPEWVDPLSVSYRGYDVYELPPNGQGMFALEILGILERMGLDALGLAAHGARDHALAFEADALHAVVEATKVAFADRELGRQSHLHSTQTSASVSLTWNTKSGLTRDPSRARRVGPCSTHPPARAVARKTHRKNGCKSTLT